MNLRTVDDIFEANRKTRARLVELLAGISEEQAASPIAGQSWTIGQIVEHIAAVEESTARVCSKLLSKAMSENDVSDGALVISEHFKDKAREIDKRKVQAPEIVQPKTGGSLEGSFARMDETARKLEDLKPLFRAFDGTKRKFPHPFFGEISAHEWLYLSGLHERRHIEQIQRLVDQ